MMDRDFFTNAGIQTNLPFIETNSSSHQPYSPSALLASMSNDAVALRELIGKLGGNFPPSSSSPNYDSGHTTPLGSPHFQISIPLNSLAGDPGFAERAAKFSCFGSRSFNGRTAPIGGDFLTNRSGSPLKLPRVSSSPALKVGAEKKFSKLSESAANSNDELSVSNDMSCRKRKGVSRPKSKQDPNSEEEEDGNGKKRMKARKESGKNEKVGGGKKREDEEEAPKDYIHVRARRGQATDSHSLAERVRREKISERMKLLQDLVPGCNKVTGKALMLDEIINYVQSLQRQVEFLSMKLASVNPELGDFYMDNLLSKDNMLQQNGSVPQEMYPLDSSMYNHGHHHQNLQQHTCTLEHVVPLDHAPLYRTNLDNTIHLDGFSTCLPEFPAFGEDDLESIVQMGFVQNPVNFPVPYQTSNMKVEL